MIVSILTGGNICRADDRVFGARQGSFTRRVPKGTLAWSWRGDTPKRL